MKYVALILSAGVGSRFGADCPKQYVVLAGKMVLQHTIDLFANNAHISHLAIVVSPDDAYIDDVALPTHASIYRVGGESRAESVANGLNTLLAQGVMQANDVILVHDGARCCLPQSALNRLIDTAGQAEHGGILAIPVADTLKRQYADAHTIQETVSRSGLWQAQTPQLFPAHLLQHALASANLAEITDDASAVERLGISPLLVEGDSRNIKLTRADDADYVAWLLENTHDIQAK